MAIIIHRCEDRKQRTLLPNNLEDYVGDENPWPAIRAVCG